MENLIAFLSSFVSYGLVFIICVAIIVVAVLIGIKARKAKNSKEINTDGINSETEN